MNALKNTMICACLALAGVGALAQDVMKKDMKDMTEADCKTWMEMMKTDTVKQEDAVMSAKRRHCTELMKKDSSSMKEPMKK